MTRRKPRFYAGATSKLTLAEAGKLDSNWVISPKEDGAYCHVHTNRDGEVFAVTNRSGKEIKTDLIGVQADLPHGIYAGEYSGYSEAGLSLRNSLGYEVVQLFDLVQLDGRYVGELSFRDRRDLLYRARGKHQDESLDKPWKLDQLGNAHDLSSGRFKRQVPTGWRRMPVIPIYPVSQLDQVWTEYVVESGGEGLVAINTQAKLGARACKRKIKPVDTIDVVALQVEPKKVVFDYRGELIVTARGKWPVEVGMVVEVSSPGWYKNGLPRHPYISRLRVDLM